MLSIYPACFYKEKEGGYSVIFPVLGIATCGDTVEEAMTMAIDCLAGYLYDAKISGETVPEPPKMEDIDVDAEYDEYESAFVNMVTVDVDEYAKKHFEKAVKKTLTIPSWLNDLAVKEGVNFSQVLQNALKQQLNV
ncbi:type II toxin-antitoxin system HicB family antitoxin [uncultured Ruminococcus sp.]|uniref:type II toxin-antitoxin system HicB family antitoxin n=1 Tax=uncultured Ruminococcus sp. TaxID=165186 RepID=UPI0025FE09DD|nr:type II toxin-antitoxin system HicB family antitoxin [uncultured Ruminococcus sp.]